MPEEKKTEGEKPNPEVEQDITKLTPEQIQTELERTRLALKAANQEAASRRKKLEAFEEAEKKKADAEKSELEKAQAKAAQLEKDLANQREASQKQTIRHTVEMAAAKMEFYDPADAVALADLSGVEIDDDGKVKGVDEALKALAKAKPHLIKTEQPGGGKPPKTDAEKRNGAGPMSLEDIIAKKRSEYSGL